jgi:hypothetical protein
MEVLLITVLVLVLFVVLDALINARNVDPENEDF